MPIAIIAAVVFSAANSKQISLSKDQDQDLFQDG